MNTNFEQNTLTIYLTGRIDTSNAATVEQEIFAALEEHTPEQVVLDAEKLDFISSVGLRIVLKVKQKYQKTAIINVQSSVYEVLEMTGFTDIMTVKKVLRQVSVEGCEIIGRGGHGTVYRLNEDTILKLYSPEEPLAEIQREVEFAKSAFVYGIPTAISYDVVRCGDSYGIVFELINADTMASFLQKHPERMEEFTGKYTDIIHTLHVTEADTTKFSSIKDLYHSWIDDMTGHYTAHELDVLHRLVDSVPECKTFVHGDIHPKNIMVQNDELVFIDMADLTYGHPIFDYAGMFLTHFLMPTRMPQITLHQVGITPEDALKLWDAILAAGFPNKTEAEMEGIRNAITGYGLLKHAISPAVNKSQDEQITSAVIQRAKENFLPIAEQFIGCVTF